MSTSFDLFSGFKSVSTVPAGNFAKALLSGAKTVKGPVPSRVAARPAACTAATTVVSIAAIQGTNTDTSPLAGQPVTTEGVVTAVYTTGGFNGFFVETGGAGGTEAEDATPGASDAVFVFGSISAAQVAVGDSVRVSGTVAEFQGQTEITSPSVTKLASALLPYNGFRLTPPIPMGLQPRLASSRNPEIIRVRTRN